MKTLRSWDKITPGKDTIQRFVVPPVETPICCENNPKALVPKDRFSTGWKPDSLKCDKDKGGCGADWIPK